MSTTIGTGPVRAATAEQVQAAWSDPKLANVLYHDWEAHSYDDKWSISFDSRCVDYARERFVHIAGDSGWPYRDALEVGSGTGFFLLNLMQAGVATRGHVTDLSPGMVEVAVANAASLSLDVEGRVADAERLPYDDSSMDLVVGHAVLHHIPDVELAIREMLRVLRPGGRFVVAGEPTRWGDYIARRLSRATWWATTHATRLPGLTGWRRPTAELDESSRAALLEAVVDLHVFPPQSLARQAIAAGAVDVKTRTVELTAAWLGWPVRTFECAVPPDKLGMRWATFAMHSWQRLSALDGVLERVVPAGVFYNVGITGVKP